MTANKVIIGNEEWCSFPGLHIPAIKARVDSGAKTSALHAFNIRPFMRNQQQWVRFCVHPLQHNRTLEVFCECAVVDQRWVKSSSGASEKRYVIKTALFINGQHLETEITLTNRDSMGYRMLLGRNAMENHFLIDPAGSCFLGKPSKKQLREYYPDQSSIEQPLKVLILAQDFSDYAPAHIQHVLKNKGYEVTCRAINNAGFNASASSVNDSGDYFDVVVAWAEGKGASLTCTYLQYYQRLGAAPINSAQVIRQALDVASTHQILCQYNIPVVNSEVILGEQAFRNACATARVNASAVLISPVVYGFAPHYQLVSAQEWYSLSADFNANDYTPLLMQTLPNGLCRRVRCLLAFDSVISAVCLPWNNATEQAEKTLLSEDEQHFVIRVANAMHLKLASIDFIRSERSIQFVALSPNPDFKLFDTITGNNMAVSVVGLIEDKWRSKVTHHG